MSSINDRISKIVDNSGLTKTAFAERINVSQQHVSRLAKDGAPSDRTIADICSKFNVSEHWLRTGEGDPYIKINRDQQITDFIGKILYKEEDAFKHRFITMLSKLSESEWEFIEAKARELVADE